MFRHATGSFDVKLVPLSREPDAGPTPARMSIDKKFQGDLDAVSRGEMLSAMTGTRGSAGYVAIEHVKGSLNGRAGEFVLQHSGTMSKGVPSLSVTVIPDSGTGGLAGLSGSMTITIVDGKHLYDFEYLLPTP